MKRIALLGSTGSIGASTLSVLARHRDQFTPVALVAGSNAAMLAEQVRLWQPAFAAVANGNEAHGFARGAQTLIEAATRDDVDVVVNAVVGAAGLDATIAALKAGKRVALANKETLVMAGELVMAAAREGGGQIVPIDSEHSAVLQCLLGRNPARIILTASGGPLRTWSRDRLMQATVAEALNHPTWSMGSKITIDSATMMNKGLEVIEARWMFGLAPEQIRVLVHPQSIVHSLVAFRDGSVKAQLGVPDMRVPIQYALTFPERWPAPHPRLDWTAVPCLDFEEPDTGRFPCLRLAFDALAAGGAAPAVLNAANEEAVALFLAERIGFTDIPRLVEAALERAGAAVPTLDALEAVDREARARVRELHGSLTI